MWKPEASARAIILIVQLWLRSFGECRFVIVAYAVYAAATVLILQLHDHHQPPRSPPGKGVEAPQVASLVGQLRFCAEFLQRVASRCPGIIVPAHAIAKHLESFGEHRQQQAPPSGSLGRADGHPAGNVPPSSAAEPSLGELFTLPSAQGVEESSGSTIDANTQAPESVEFGYHGALPTTLEDSLLAGFISQEPWDAVVDNWTGDFLFGT